MKTARACALSSTAALLFATACAQIPDRRDPFAGLDVKRGESFSGSGAPAPLSGLTIGLIPSENTLKSVDYLRELHSLHSLNGVDPQAPIEDVLRILKPRFKSVFRAKNVADARDGRADAAMVLDVYLVVPYPPRVTVTVDIKASFLTPDGAEIETVDGHGEANGFAHSSTGATIDAAERLAVDSLTKALDASQKLPAYAGSRTAAPAAAVAAAPSGPIAKKGHSDADKPAYSHGEDPTRFAVVVGVENYESLPPADYAERDASAVRRHLLALGYPERNVIFLTGQKAGKSGIEKYVESWLPRNIGENDQVFFYFSGHGAPDPKTGQAYLMPWDGDAKFLDTTGYPLKNLYSRLAALKAKRVIVALDSCFSGAGGRSVLAKGARPLVVRVDAGVPASDKLSVLAAASGDEITGTDDAQAHGLFTYYLLKGLNAAGGDATVGGLYDYLKPKVQDEARRDNRDQTPQLLGPARGGL